MAKRKGIIYTKAGDNYVVGTDQMNSNNNAVESGETLINVVLPCFIDNIVVTKLGNYAFRYNPSIQTFVISRTIKEIGYDAIAWISTLKKLSFEANSQIEKIGQGFAHFIGIKTIIMPPTIKSIGDYIFGGTTLDDLIFCSYINNLPESFNGRNSYYYPKRVHVPKYFPYSKLGNYPRDLLFDGICEEIFYKIATKCIKSLSSFAYNQVALFLLII